MNKYKINYTSLFGKQASIFIKAHSAAGALKTFKKIHSGYKAESIEEIN